MCTKVGNQWMEYKDPIDLMHQPSNMESGLCWHEKGTNNKWTYNDIDHLMRSLETMIAIASMTYTVGVIDWDAYELHMGDEKVFDIFIDEC